MPGKMIFRSLALLLAAVSFSAVRLSAQDDTVAEAARRARQQKQNSPKPARVIDNDTLTPAPVAPAPDSTSSPASPPSSPAPATPSKSDASVPPENAPASSAKKGAADSGDDAEKKAKIEALKQEIADKQQSINLQQREIALDQDTFYSNPDHVHDTAGKQKLDSMKSNLNQQQAELAELQAKLANLAPATDTTKSPEPPKP